MSDKSFGDYANRNIVKNPLLSTAVTGLSIEDLTHNAVLVPVAPNQALITGSEVTGTYSQTLASTEHEQTNFPSGDSVPNILLPPPSTSTYPHTLDSQIGQHFDRQPELTASTVSKASSKSEDDFDVNEYFARLQGTRYVSAPLHSHPDPKANLTDTEENLEEINLNDDKTQDVQNSLTADIAQNFSQLPNVLPQVASAVFSSFSNMWNMKSRDNTPDDRAQSYQDVQFQGNQPSGHFQVLEEYREEKFQENPQSKQFQSQSLGANVSTVPMMNTEDVVKEVAPPPKEPPVCGTSNFRLTTKKKYAQIPGLSTREPQQIAFNPLTQNVPSYFNVLPTENTHKNITEENKETFSIGHSSIIREQTPKNTNESYNIFTPINDTIAGASECPPNVSIGTNDHPKLYEETPPPLNIQNEIPVIPPPPMFSTQRRESSTGKSVLPPSVARRIGSNHPVIRQQIMQPALTDNIFIPTFDSTPTSGPIISTGNTPMPTYVNQSIQPEYQETSSVLQTRLPPQLSQTNIAGFESAPPDRTPAKNILSDKTAAYIFEPTKETDAPSILTPTDIGSRSDVAPSSSVPTSLQQSSILFSPYSQTASALPTVATVASYSGHNQNSYIVQTSTTTCPTNSDAYKEDTTSSESLKSLVEPPKAIGTSNFRMIKKRPQYYSGPIEGIGSISNSIKPLIPAVDSGTFQGALFTPEQPIADINAPSFDISKQTAAEISCTQFDITKTASNLPTAPFVNQETSYPNLNPPSYQESSQPYNTSFDLSVSTTSSYEPREDYKESKGFGIIGSLKSKLSSIDINKIHSSVTTFFDPGYNDIKKDTVVAQEDVPYYPPPYHTQTQSSFELFMPRSDAIDQSLPFISSNMTNPNIYDEIYDQSNEYAYCQENLPFGDPNYVYQTYSTSYYSDPKLKQQHVSDVYFQRNTTEISDTKYEDNENKFTDIQAVDVNKSISNTQIKDTSIAETVNIPKVGTTSGYFETESRIQSHSNTEHKHVDTDTLKTEPALAVKSNILQSESAFATKSTGAMINKYPDVSSFAAYTEYKDPKASAYLPDKNTKLDHDASNYELYTTNVIEGDQKQFPSQPITSENKSMFNDGARKSHIPGYGTQSMESFVMAADDNITKSLIQSDNTKPDKNLNTKNKEDILEKDHLLRSLSKEELPILGVSSVPLFGLSTIVSDKLKRSGEHNDAISSPLYERATENEDKNVSISFFENISTVDKRVGEHDALKNESILDTNRNLSLLEKSSETKTEGCDAQISNASFFTITQNPEECDNSKKVDILKDEKTNLYENVVILKDDVSKAHYLDMYAHKDEVLTAEANIYSFKDTANIAKNMEHGSDINICETCREVNKPVDKDIDKDDLTMQLIENITSPIQLSNPVEVPLTEDDFTERVEFDADKYEEISHITEETIETIHVQSANELLDDEDIKTINYGWATEENHTTNPINQYNYGYEVNPNSIGFFGNSLRSDKVPTNASDELKAEFKILPRQMSIPSAPPAEEDSKSDEAGILDVQSIELDAKEDFPLYGEFVIEPSETDDDKIEFKEKEKAEESDCDSFTNRIEKFKKMEEITDIKDQNTLQDLFDLHNQPISMASYFDTGNFAAETHYRNTFSPSHISIPPGFEEEFKKRLALAKTNELIKTIPDTTTQTKPTTSVTTAHSNIPVGFNVVTTVSKIVQEKTPFCASEFIKTPESSLVFGSESIKISSSLDYESIDVTKQGSEIASEETKADHIGGIKLTKASPIFGSGAIQIPEASSQLDSGAVEMPKTSAFFSSEAMIPESSNMFNPSATIMPKSSSFFNPNHDNTIVLEPTASKTKSSIKIEAPELPDPINFFADSNTNIPSANVNRLASYFSSPPKTEHAKSFFELSQSQNHYKHASNVEEYDELMKDLTSVQNMTVPTEQTIRHVNYFTVEYDVVLPEFSKGDSSADVLMDTDDKDLESLNHCSLCTALIYQKRYKVRASVNNTTEERNNEPNMETSSAGTKNSVTVNFDGVQLTEDTNESIDAQSENRSNPEYGPVKHHWFYRVDVDEKSIWRGFSVQDSRALETTFLSPDLNEDTLVPTDGGRYDVNLVGRLRIPVYWTDKPTNVRRCSWFYKGTTDPRYVPYTENVAEKLEEEYWHGITTGEWHRRLVLPNGEVVVMHGPNVMVHFLHSDAFSTPPPANPFSQLFSFGKRVYRNPPKIRVSSDQPQKIDHLIFLVHGAGEYRIQKEKNQSCSRPRVVRRGYDDSEIEDAEPSSIDHLLLLCHGVGSACDMRFRSVEEVVEDFRSTSLQLVQSHYKNSYDQGIVNRVEVLPISWHAALHSGETGVDRRLAQITLDSIPRLRNFTNDTVLDVLFYTSPVFCQTILNTVCKELNRIYQLFKVRNPSFNGQVSLGGHSLGSVILYDLLCHQSKDDRRESQMSGKHYVAGPNGAGRPSVQYPHLEFEPAALYALGSPIAIFECIRGVDSLGTDFSLPTCKNFFNIFHPYDPIAYRIEPLINSRLKELKPYLIPHHKGRKRMHLELKDTMARVGADLKQKLMESLRNTWNKWKAAPTDGALERVVEEELDKEPLFDENKEESAKERELSTPEMLGQLNGGRRVDYVLQEAPLEVINEYLFAMSSHVGYWESEDTMLLMLREIYSALGVQPDSTIPQQSMSVQRTRRLEGTSTVSTDSPSTSGSIP